MNRLYSLRRACNFLCTFNVSVNSILTLNRNMVYGSFYNQDLLFSFSQQTQFISSYRVSESRLTHRSYLLPPQHITINKKKRPPLHLQLITYRSNHIVTLKIIYIPIKVMIHRLCQTHTDSCILQWEFMDGQCT